MVLENTIVDCFGNGQMYLAIVAKSGAERVLIEDASGRQSKIAASLILNEHGKTGANKLMALAEAQSRIQELVEEIDCDLLWNDWLEKGGEPGLSKIAIDYFGNDDATSVSAIARFLINDTLHFQRQGRTFTPRTHEGVEEMQKLLAMRAEKAAFKERRFQWLASTLATPAEKCPVPVPEEMEPFVQQCLDYLLLGFNGEWVNLLATIRPKMTARECALLLLHQTSRLPADADEFLLVNGLHAGFTKEVLDYTDSLPEYIPIPNRQNWDGVEIFSIDDATTREIDDALSLEKTDEGWIVGIHLSNPACYINKDDCLDNVAVERPLSLYLPTTTVMMFPDRLGTDLASLKADVLRPAMSFRITFDDEGEVQNWQLLPSQLKVTSRLTYDEADKLIADNDGSPLSDKLNRLAVIASQLLENREACGAISLNRPEIRVSVKNDEITLYEENQDTPSHRLVQEFMVLANHLAAKYALRNDVPIIYRTQDEPYEDAHTVRPYNPVLFDQEVRKMRRTRLSTYPQSHAGLGLDIYTQISSPLRRYADLVLQRQLSAHLNGEPLPYSQEELFAVLDNVERTTAQNRSLEREARQYWIMEYIRRNELEKEIMATVVKIEGSLTLAELDKYYVRGVLLSREKMHIGERCRVRVTDVRPKLGRMTLTLD